MAIASCKKDLPAEFDYSVVIVPCSQSEKLFKKIVSLNSENKLILFANCGHEFNDDALFQVFQETINLVKK
jgi:hypothetical protein